jgi:hypothetical protein
MSASRKQVRSLGVGGLFDAERFPVCGSVRRISETYLVSMRGRIRGLSGAVFLQVR